MNLVVSMIYKAVHTKQMYTEKSKLIGKDTKLDLNHKPFEPT